MSLGSGGGRQAGLAQGGQRPTALGLEAS